jgi:DNA invertase Pin-like site-specific DNA recombinase
METKQLPAAIYARISSDREGAGLGVERQESDCRALAERLGWDVVAVYVDNDISAYSGAPRPEYRAMLEAVRAGQVQGVIAWHTDRLHRRAAELEEFVTIAEAHHLQVQTVTAGTVDLSSASGRMIARMLGAAAQHEVEHARERMKRAKSQMALDGKYRGGPRPFGYEKDGLTIRESEAAAIREATTAVLAGRTLAAVARDMNARGITTSAGRDWTYGRLKEMLVRPRNAGLLAHGLPGRLTYRERDSKVRYPTEIIGPASWPAIVSEDQWRALVTMLTDPSRRNQDGNDTRWLGSGIYLCGICGSRLRPAPYGGTAASSTRTRKYLYRCTESAHLTISAKETDEHVRGVVADLIRDPRVVAAMNPTDTQLVAAREERAALAGRLQQFESDYALGRITGAQLQKATAAVTEELAAVDSRLTKVLRRSASSAVLAANDPGLAFLNAPIDIQRAVLSTVLRVEVVTAKEAGVAVGGKWSADRVRVAPASAAS